eukprot:756779-Hanusia_phi.AAC.8
MTDGNEGQKAKTRKKAEEEEEVMAEKRKSPKRSSKFSDQFMENAVKHVSGVWWPSSACVVREEMHFRGEDRTGEGRRGEEKAILDCFWDQELSRYTKINMRQVQSTIKLLSLLLIVLSHLLVLVCSSFHSISLQISTRFSSARRRIKSDHRNQQ